MFDFNKIKMMPRSSKGFKIPATDEQISELEIYCGHKLPENYKNILKNFNGGSPQASFFDVVDRETGIQLEKELAEFYFLDDNKSMPDNIWWVIKTYGKLLGPDILPFADDGLQQVYYLKWKNNVPQIWFLSYLDLDEPEAYLMKNSFDDLLESLYEKL